MISHNCKIYEPFQHSAVPQITRGCLDVLLVYSLFLLTCQRMYTTVGFYFYNMRASLIRCRFCVFQIFLRLATSTYLLVSSVVSTSLASSHPFSIWTSNISFDWISVISLFSFFVPVIRFALDFFDERVYESVDVLVESAPSWRGHPIYNGILTVFLHTQWVYTA